MSKEDWRKQTSDTYAFFDSLTDATLMGLIETGKHTEELMKELEDLFESQYLERYPDNEYLFNVWDSSDLEHYLEYRFRHKGLIFQEVNYRVVAFRR